MNGEEVGVKCLGSSKALAIVSYNIHRMKCPLGEAALRWVQDCLETILGLQSSMIPSEN